LGEVDGEAENDEGDDLAETGERRVEPFDLAFVGGRFVAEEDPCGEDGKEPRPVGEGGDGEEDHPRTESTTAGSVGATAVATSSAGYHLRPNAKWASSAAPPTVRNVPTIPTTATGAAAERIWDQPMCMPPSKRMHTNATVTTRCTVRSGGRGAIR
jgi:hypothetical protein